MILFFPALTPHPILAIAASSPPCYLFLPFLQAKTQSSITLDNNANNDTTLEGWEGSERGWQSSSGRVHGSTLHYYPPQTKISRNE